MPRRTAPAAAAPARTPLTAIPGVGPSVARDLRELGYRWAEDLRGADPERMYRRLIRRRGVPQDRCVLYVFRCAVYFASRRRPRPERLQWWTWSDQRLAAASSR